MRERERRVERERERETRERGKTKQIHALFLFFLLLFSRELSEIKNEKKKTYFSTIFSTAPSHRGVRQPVQH